MDEIGEEWGWEMSGGAIGWLTKQVDSPPGGPTMFVASTPGVDRHGDSVEQSWRLASWRKNPVILWEHGSNVVGKGTAKIVQDGEERYLSLAVTWHESALNPLGMLAAEQHREGFRSAVSVGFIPGRSTSRTKLPTDSPLYLDPAKVPEWQAGRLFQSPELLEVSTASVPANAAALQARAYAAEVEATEDQVMRYLQAATSEKVRTLIRDASRENPAIMAEVRRFVLGQKTPQPGATPLPWMV